MVEKKAISKAYTPQNAVNINVNEKLIYRCLKRGLDFFGSLFGIILLSLVFIIVAVAIKLEDPKGRVFFSQKRIGKNGEVFNMYKFRSMISDAESKLEELLDMNETTGAMFKMKNDPRVTKIGRVIRKTSIDELPQLFNVLKGDMSLVGPRPPLPREVKEYSAHHMQRLLVIPGCTGLWQISGRSNIGFEEMVDLDLQYIQKRNFLMDIQIIFKTVIIIFKNQDAY
ncbi:sugar transferase [Priestia megaterium]|uniref:sugar transferase n=1 Tax=Priestia megaterium TaxID=1404 RepID=UPI0039F142F0